MVANWTLGVHGTEFPTPLLAPTPTPTPTPPHPHPHPTPPGLCGFPGLVGRLCATGGVNCTEFVKDCAAAPAGDLFTQRNPTCNSRQYSGGLSLGTKKGRVVNRFFGIWVPGFVFCDLWDLCRTSFLHFKVQFTTQKTTIAFFERIFAV